MKVEQILIQFFVIFQNLMCLADVLCSSHKLCFRRDIHISILIVYCIRLCNKPHHKIIIIPFGVFF